MSESSLKIYFPSHKLQNTDVRLKTNSGEKIRPLCKVNVDVSLNQQTTNQNLNVVLENGPNLFDRDCLKCLRLEWREIKSIRKVTLRVKVKCRKFLRNPK